jgi:hypothetical protein
VEANICRVAYLENVLAMCGKACPRKFSIIAPLCSEFRRTMEGESEVMDQTLWSLCAVWADSRSRSEYALLTLTRVVVPSSGSLEAEGGPCFCIVFVCTYPYRYILYLFYTLSSTSAFLKYSFYEGNALFCDCFLAGSTSLQQR